MSVSTLLAAAEAALDGTDDGLVTAARNFKTAAALAASQRDYDSAIRAAEGALAIIALTPDSEQRGAGFGTRLEWRESDIQVFLTRMKRLQATTVGNQIVEVCYERETDTC